MQCSAAQMGDDELRDRRLPPRVHVLLEGLPQRGVVEDLVDDVALQKDILALRSAANADRPLAHLDEEAGERSRPPERRAARTHCLVALRP